MFLTTLDRNDNLCTRFATEISLRREATSSLDLKIIPGEKRSKPEQEKMKNFSESITDLKELPRIMQKAMKVMGISDGESAFAEDILSIEIQGPDRPQLTLVDIPGIIQSSTRGISNSDVAMVTGITKRYIRQRRTICLAVISATNDAANQPILQQVRKFDPRGEAGHSLYLKLICKVHANMIASGLWASLQSLTFSVLAQARNPSFWSLLATRMSFSI